MNRLATTVAAVLLATTAFAAAQAGEIDLTLNGVQPKGGKILVSVQSRDQFMQHAQTSGAVLDGAVSGQVKVRLADVPPGDYAVSVLHDADGSWSMTNGADGKPAEGWAMSSAAPLKSVPAFDQVKVSVKGDAAITQMMMYPK